MEYNEIGEPSIMGYKFLVFFVLAKLSVFIAFLSLIGFCGWETGNLSFDFSSMEDFIMAVVIRVGDTLIASIIFILFAS